MGFPIRRSPDQSLFSDSPELIAASHVLYRLPAPRHPPYALSNLTIKFGQDKSLPLRDASTRPWDEKDSFQLSKICFYSIPRPGGYFLYPKLENGGADQDRTGDLRRAKPALSQLSYSPIVVSNFSVAGEAWWA
jgi:hypothetical protein